MVCEKLRKISKILIANRGEIAVRVIKTCKLLGIKTVAVYSDVDSESPHVLMADEAFCLGPALAASSYLNAEALIFACLTTKADAVHPGYGFLSENAEFASRCAENDITFIGPRPESIMAIGDKISSKLLLTKRAPQVPLLPGYNGSDQNPEVLVNEALKIGFPVLLKASAGGGGKGMRIVRHKEQLKEEIQSAQGEAKRSFGDSRLLIEKYIETARHIEIQIFGDTHGNATAIFERECSVQRRHQKIIEECPSPFLTPKLREQMSSSAVAIARLISYVGAGTVEFIVDGATGKYYFLEVNTRLQVEHPVTEEVTGLDLVALQIWVAQGGRLDDFLDKFGGISMKGHAIEVRIYAEDPDNDFFPVTGRITKWSFPEGEGIRSDSGIAEGSEITSYYDPLISKLTVHGATRQEAIQRLIGTLSGTNLLGLPAHNIKFLLSALNSREFQSGVYATNLVSILQGSGALATDSDIVAKRLSTAAIVATAWEWVRNQRHRKSLPYRRVPPGFRNVPHKFQWRKFQVNTKPGQSGGSQILVEYEMRAGVEYHETKSALYMRVSEVSPAVKKGENDVSVVIWEGVAVIISSSFDAVHTDAPHVNGNVRVLIDGVQQTFFASLSRPEKTLFLNTREWNGGFVCLSIIDKYKSKSEAGFGGDGIITTPMPCRIISVNLSSGVKVNPGDTLLTIESMKMETKLKASIAGIVSIKVKEGDMMKAGDTVAQIVSET